MRLCSVILFYRRYFKSLRFPSNQFDYVKFETQVKHKGQTFAFLSLPSIGLFVT